MIEKDPRYATIKKLIVSGHVLSFEQIFTQNYISKNRVCKDLRFNLNRLKGLLTNPSGWILKDLYKLSELIEVEFIVIAGLVDAQIKKGN